MDREMSARLGRLVKELRGGSLAEGSCLKPHEVEGLVGGGASEEERLGMLSHIARCETCLEVVQVAARVGREEGGAKAPVAVTARARDLMPGVGRRLMDLVVRVGREAVEVISTTGVCLPQREGALGAVRGQALAKSAAVRAAEGEPPVEVHVEPEDNGRFSLLLSLESLSSRDLRLSLHKDGRVVRSSVVASGQACFGHLRPGAYLVTIHGGGEPLGSLSIRAGV